MNSIDLAPDMVSAGPDTGIPVTFEIDFKELSPEQLEQMREVAEPLLRLGELAGILSGLTSSEEATKNMKTTSDHFNWRSKIEAAKIILGGNWPAGLSPRLPGRIDSEEELPVIDANNMRRLSKQLSQMKKAGAGILKIATRMHPDSGIVDIDDLREYYGLDYETLEKATAIIDADTAAKALRLKETTVSFSYLNVLKKLKLGQPSSLDDARSIELPSYDMSSPVTLMEGGKIRQRDVADTIIKELSVAILGVLRQTVANPEQASIKHNSLSVDKLLERADGLTNKHAGRIDKVVITRIPISQQDVQRFIDKGATEQSMARFRVHAELHSTGKGIFVTYFETTVYTAEVPDGSYRLVATTNKSDNNLSSEQFRKILVTEGCGIRVVLDSNSTEVSGGLPTLGKDR